MKIAYIAGPYRAENWEGVKRNIAHARRVAVRYWRLGYAVFCPHLNSAHLDDVVPDEVFLAGDIAILKRCDVVVAMKTWSKSKGAAREIELADELQIEVIYDDTD